MQFDYKKAFSKNVGLLDEREQERLRESRIAIAGLGGVGGHYLISFARQGFERFNVADPDNFETTNCNRQYGAYVDSDGKPKVEVMEEEVKRVNPNCSVKVFEDGINCRNLEDFFGDVDLAIDGLDFFAFDIRREYFKKAREMGKPVISAGPLGFGTACIILDNKSPSFDEYFGIDGNMSYHEKLIAFGLGAAPKRFYSSYMKGVNLEEEKGPSSIVGVDLCSGVVICNAVKMLIGRGDVKTVPYVHQFDAYKNKYVCRKRFFYGKRDLLRGIKTKIALKMIQG